MEEPIRKHEREIRRHIILPVLLSGLLLVLITIVLFVLAMTDNITGQQIAVIAGLMMIVFVLLPMVLLTLILNALLLFLAFGSGKIHGVVETPLRLARHYSAKTAEFTHSTSERITKPVIETRARLEGWQSALNHLLGVPEPKKEGEVIRERK